jgi:putative hydrolase of the HAD superfamily
MIELVALDADDTLWHNEPLYTTTREQFCALLAKYEPSGVPDERLNAAEMRNLEHFGYGVKGFVLSMIETAIEVTDGRIDARDVSAIVGWGKDMLASPVEVLDGVRETVATLAESYRLILVTKGDLLHQETKLARSGLGPLFTAIEIVSEKDARLYRNIMTRYGVAPPSFVMVGNSLRSDILPVLEAGGHAIHVPYHMSWSHEHVPDEALAGARFERIAHIRELPGALRAIAEEAGSTRPRAVGPAS